jgi:membrane-associated phospholipid phosphatase
MVTPLQHSKHLNMQKTTGNSDNLAAGRHLYSCDKLAIGMLVVFGSILIAASGRGPDYFFFGFLHLLFAGLIWWLATRRPAGGFLRSMRYIYPVAVLAVIHYDVGYFIHMIYGEGHTFDTGLKHWEAGLLGINPHLYLHAVIPKPVWAEVIHFFYLTYYPILVGSLIWIWKSRIEEFPRFAFVYMGMFLTFVLIFSLFPVIGPLDYREGLFDGKSVLSGLIDFLFYIGAPDGAAFPSSHVGQSVGIYMLMRPMSRELRVLLIVCIIGIGFSMIYGSIHYTVDAIAGFIAGLLFYYLWNGLYYRFLKEEMLTRISHR